MSTLPNLLGWFFPQRQAKSQQISGRLAKPHSILANYRHGRAIVETSILPGQVGRVWFKGSWWPARCPQELALFQGQSVRVIDIDRITLIVEPLAETIPEATPAVTPETPLSAPAATVRYLSR